MEKISNEHLSIAVKEHGAELASIICHGREYLWQADKRFWQRHSPVLFPIVGSLWQGKCRVNGVTYSMGQHGFARDMDFELVEKTSDLLRYRLCSSACTLEKYPYDFTLYITYKIEGNRLRVIWDVENSGTEPLPFQIGAHPAFYWPMLDAAAIEAGVDAMDPVLASTDRRGYFHLEAKQRTLPISIVTEGGCFGAEGTITLDDSGYLPLSVETFDNDALVFEDSLITKVTLCDDNKKPYVALEFSSPLVGLWSPPHKRAPFVCIEPWYGRADSVGFSGDFSQKKWMQHLLPHQSFNASYDIIIY